MLDYIVVYWTKVEHKGLYRTIPAYTGLKWNIRDYIELYQPILD